MSSLLQSFLDPKKNTSAAQHVKAALSRRFRSYGVRCDEVESKEVVNRLQREMASKSRYLPEPPQARQTPFGSSLLAHVKKRAGQIPVFHQARFFSSVAAEQMHGSPNDSKKNIFRPLSPHLPVYKPQLSSTLSITHRITGAFLSAVILSFHLLYLKMGPICLSFENFYQFLFYSSKLTLVTLELSALAFAYHLWNGIRHLRQDFGGIRGKRLK
ncbi:succinate dehydrogenase subunit 3-1, mitochondrial-like [Punica granatum]|nr:succinate dehydrogenase subunit 3-1, mitochondrial-like [Punica granatum]